METIVGKHEPMLLLFTWMYEKMKDKGRTASVVIIVASTTTATADVDITTDTAHVAESNILLLKTKSNNDMTEKTYKAM